nr:hypothetical protein Itr_chr01CG08790 [Ipomoea trifida]
MTATKQSVARAMDFGVLFPDRQSSDRARGHLRSPSPSLDQDDDRTDPWRSRARRRQHLLAEAASNGAEPRWCESTVLLLPSLFPVRRSKGVAERLDGELWRRAACEGLSPATATGGGVTGTFDGIPRRALTVAVDTNNGRRGPTQAPAAAAAERSCRAEVPTPPNHAAASLHAPPSTASPKLESYYYRCVSFAGGRERQSSDRARGHLRSPSPSLDQDDDRTDPWRSRARRRQHLLAEAASNGAEPRWCESTVLLLPSLFPVRRSKGVAERLDGELWRRRMFRSPQHGSCNGDDGS